ncbi:hypothetical protein OPT61_g1219 [Boeremia exigua]|uniref:Uncharacterized protein n=1 Tax=Boeremia exigua TaxID=749465 RepID=A0ACC2IQY8_9PLEO|nr:hypothetical protein OPT61_g1219 [Boeremia exigua]
MTSSRPNQRDWVTAYEDTLPATCATLRVLSNTVEFGLACVFAEEDGDPLPNSVNTACLPWATGSVPASSVFYSPATACPTSWTAVATRTAAEGTSDWIDGETALECCPAGFAGGAGGMCNPGTSGTTPVVRCGEADAEENENELLTAGSWPASVSARITALQLRYQPTDVGLSATATGDESSPANTSTNSPGPGSRDGELSVRAKAAIGTVVPLVLILLALTASLLWRKRKHKMTTAALTSHKADEHETKDSYMNASLQPRTESKGFPVAVAPGIAATTRDDHHETPEWNAELDAINSERKIYAAVQGSLFTPGQGVTVATPSLAGANNVCELGGIMRVNRKPVAPVELDSTPVPVELKGDANTEIR